MFGLFKKDPIKKLEQEHRRLLEEAMRLQRSGDLRAYSAKLEEADAVADRIAALEKEKK